MLTSLSHKSDVSYIYYNPSKIWWGISKIMFRKFTIRCCETHNKSEKALHGRGSNSQRYEQKHPRPYRSNAKQRVTETYMPTFGEGFNHANFSGWENLQP